VWLCQKSAMEEGIMKFKRFSLFRFLISRNIEEFRRQRISALCLLLLAPLHC